MTTKHGPSPGSKGADLRGLKVAYADLIREHERNGYGRLSNRFRPAGWYIWAKFFIGRNLVWQAVGQLRFLREIDAMLAMRALVAVGLDSAKRMKAAGPQLVIQTAYEALQW